MAHPNPALSLVQGVGTVLQVYARLAPRQRIAVSELCSRLINTCKLPAGHASDLAYYLVSLHPGQVPAQGANAACIWRSQVPTGPPPDSPHLQDWFPCRTHA